MWLVLYLLIQALPVRGDLRVNLEPAVYPGADSAEYIELSYEIPYSSMTFLRDDSGFVARFRVAVQLMDRRGEPLSNEIRQESARVSSYDRTMAPESAATGLLRLRLPTGAVTARIDVADLSSERKAAADYRIARPEGGMSLRLTRQSRRYGLADTIEAMAEIIRPGVALDSFRFRVMSQNRVVAGAVEPAESSLGRSMARFRLAVSDSAGTARFGAGEYVLAVAAGRGSATTGFKIDVPFFFDEKAYARRVDQLLYVARIDEIRRLKAVPRVERESTWHAFWKSRDLTPTTGRNEREEEYFERIDYADSHFSRGDRGYRSDRAHVYVLYGPPDQVDASPFEIDVPAAETWYYYQLNKQFYFVDRLGAGVYVLQNPEAIDVR